MLPSQDLGLLIILMFWPLLRRLLLQTLLVVAWLKHAISAVVIMIEIHRTAYYAVAVFSSCDTVLLYVFSDWQ